MDAPTVQLASPAKAAPSPRPAGSGQLPPAMGKHAPFLALILRSSPPKSDGEGPATAWTAPGDAPATAEGEAVAAPLSIDPALTTAKTTARAGGTSAPIITASPGSLPLPSSQPSPRAATASQAPTLPAAPSSGVLAASSPEGLSPPKAQPIATTPFPDEASALRPVMAGGALTEGASSLSAPTQSSAPISYSPASHAEARSVSLATEPPTVQLARAVAASTGERQLEVRLDPPQLGRVRIEFDFAGDTVRAIVSAAEPETLNLLRRGAGQLARDLAELGYADAELDFAGGERNDHRDVPDTPWTAVAMGSEAPSGEPVRAAHVRPRPAGLIDLRL